jgi:hypothetical protein
MKNYSSLQIGVNENIREMYERSASQASIKSCGTPKKLNIFNVEVSEDTGATAALR